jgi:hypothetical protein
VGEGEFMSNAIINKKSVNKKSNNGNKVNTATLTPVGISNLSDFHKASLALAKLSAKHTADKKLAVAELEEAKEKRAKGQSDSIAKALGKIDKIDHDFKEACQPHNKKQSEVKAMIDDMFYYGYKIAMEKGDARATGKVSIVKNQKGEKVTTTFDVKKDDTFYGYTKAFLEKLGVSNLDNDLAMDKVCKVLVTRCAGRQKDASTGMLKDRNKSVQKDIFIRAIIQYLVEDRHALVVREDGTLCKKSEIKEA